MILSCLGGALGTPTWGQSTLIPTPRLSLAGCCKDQEAVQTWRLRTSKVSRGWMGPHRAVVQAPVERGQRQVPGLSPLALTSATGREIWLLAGGG